MNVSRIAAIATLLALSFSSAAAAAGLDEQSVTPAAADTVTFTVPRLEASQVKPVSGSRPVMLPVLYATLGMMQAWDAKSTSSALNAGSREANPVASPFAQSTGSLLGLKAATTAGTIFFAEKMWKKNRTGAVVLMALINGATAAVAMNNMRNARMASGR